LYIYLCLLVCNKNTPMLRCYNVTKVSDETFQIQIAELDFVIEYHKKAMMSDVVTATGDGISDV